MKEKLKTAFSARQYMQSRDFELYYYSDHNLSKVKNHSHDYYEFYFFLEGDIRMHIAGRAYPLQYGDVILIPPGVKHHATIGQAKTYRRFVLWIGKDCFDRLLAESEDYGYLIRLLHQTKEYVFHNSFVEFNSLQALVMQLLEALQTEHFGRTCEVELLLRTLLLRLNQTAYERMHSAKESATAELYLNLCDYISNHLDEPLSLDILSGKFYVSKYYISHTFKDHMGISLHQYIAKKRLSACRDAMKGGRKISDVYQQFGFHDYSSFFKAFKKEFGISPKEYQELYGSAAAAEPAPSSPLPPKRP